VLDFIYYPVSFILWCWHWVYGHVFGEASAVAWALGIIFLVFTLRAIMFKPFVKQVRAMRQMQQFAPEMKKIQKKYANDKQRQAQEVQKLQREHGFSPLSGCLPMVLQIPVFIGLFQVLREFKPNKTENYFFDAQGVASYVSANLFGARLSNFITQPIDQITELGANRISVILVSIPLMILASVLTHLTARHSVARQNPEAATPQTAIMNKVQLYVFPLGVLVFGFLFPIGLLLYWLANNSWTLMQQHVVYRRIDREEKEKKAAAQEKRASLGPKPGQKPAVKRRPVQGKPSAAKPATPKAKSTQPVKPDEGAEAVADGADGADGGTLGKTTSTNRKPPVGKRPTDGRKPPAGKPAGTPGTPGTAKPTDNGTENPGLISDRSRKRSGRKNR
jgi:YidC/Oxa1 family membrane protein insertase